MKKKYIRWLLAFILLIALIILADMLVYNHNKRQVPDNTEKSKHEQTRYLTRPISIVTVAVFA